MSYFPAKASARQRNTLTQKKSRPARGLARETRSLKAISTYLVILIYAVMSLFRDFAAYTGSDFFNRKNNIRFEFRRSDLVENDTSLAYGGQF